MNRYKIDPETGEAQPLVKDTKVHFLPQLEVNGKPSMTIPDATMPLRTLIERYVRGIPVPTKQPIFDKEDVTSEDYLPDPKTLDLAEREEMAQKYAEELQQYKEAHLPRKGQEDPLKSSTDPSTQTQTQKPTNNE